MLSRALLASLAVGLVACSGPAGAGPEPAALTMRVARASHSALPLSDGRVLLFGGCVRESCDPGPDSSTVDAFDPKTQKFELAGRLLNPRLSTRVAALRDGSVLLAGGWAGSEVTAKTEIFDVAAGRSRPGPDLSSARADMAVATLADGRVLLIGGYDGANVVAAIDLFDPANASMKRIGNLAVARAGAGAALLPDGRVLVVGGGTGGQGAWAATETAEIVDPATGASKLAGSLAERRYKHAVVGLKDGRVLVLGGSDERDSRGKLDSIEIYDPASGRFRSGGRMLARRYKIANAVTLLGNGKVLVAGGAPRAEIYDPASGRSVAAGPDFGGSLNFSSVTRLAGGGVLVAGGYYEDGIRMSRGAWLLR